MPRKDFKEVPELTKVKEFQRAGGIHVIDTFAWIEYINGTEAGKKVMTRIKSGNVVTPTIVIGELVSKLERENIEKKDEIISFILGRTEVSQLNVEIAISAGKIHAEYKKKIPRLSLPDAVIIATAAINGAKIITGDEHFRNFDNVIMIK